MLLKCSLVNYYHDNNIEFTTSIYHYSASFGLSSFSW